jgi:hypothetical protein
MKKGRGQNPDYYKLSGGEPGRPTYARERRKLSQGRPGSPASPPHPSGSAAKGAGAETLKRLRERASKRSSDRIARKVEQDELSRALEAQSGAAPINHQLPAAEAWTQLHDLRREAYGHALAAWRALGQLTDAVLELARSPLRAWRVLREA